MGPQGPQAIAIIWEQIERQLELIRPFTPAQLAPAASDSRHPVLITPKSSTLLSPQDGYPHPVRPLVQAT